MIINVIKNNIQTLIQLLGLGSVALLAFQLYSTNKWNKKLQSLNQLDHSFIVDNIKLLKDAGFNIKRFPMNESDFSKLLEDNNHHLKKAAESVLNKLEFFSISYNMNMFDKHYIFHAYSDDIIEVYEYFEPLIKNFCIKDELYYSEFKKCYKSIKKIENFEILKVKLNSIFFKR
jgi:hypothetical protein